MQMKAVLLQLALYVHTPHHFCSLVQLCVTAKDDSDNRTPSIRDRMVSSTEEVMYLMLFVFLKAGLWKNNLFNFRETSPAGRLVSFSFTVTLKKKSVYRNGFILLMFWRFTRLSRTVPTHLWILESDWSWWIFCIIKWACMQNKKCNVLFMHFSFVFPVMNALWSDSSLLYNLYFI